jgi:hypothetical protein
MHKRAQHKRSAARKRVHIWPRRAIGREAMEKKFRVSVRPQVMHEPSTGFPQLDRMWRAHYALCDGFVIAVARGT